MNKKGFTLVELLGVLILLGLVSILVVPNIFRTSSKAEENSFKESVKGLIRGIEEYYAQSISNFPEDGLDFTLDNFPSDIEMENMDKFTSGQIIMNGNTLEAVCVTDGTYYASGKRNSLIISTDCSNE